MNRYCALPARGVSRGAPSYAAYLPPVPSPPHDPYTLLLEGRVGWRPMLDSKSKQAATIAPIGEGGSLMLLPLAGSGRRLLETSGSFGGLVLPRHLAFAALDPCRSVLLLYDAKDKRMLRFDPCACAFVEFFCLRHGDPRLPSGPATIAANGNRLYLADPAGHRVVVLNAANGAARSVWCAPLRLPDGPLADWQPAALAIAPNRDVWVGDRMNGLLLRLSPGGKVLERHDGFGAVSALAADCEGRLLVAADGAEQIVFYEPMTRTRLVPPSRPADIINSFPPLALTVMADGSVDLSALCKPACDAPCVFDTSGELLGTVPFDPPLQFPAAGTWITQALDSGIAECVWDRIVLDASMAAHTGLAIETLSAETELTPDEVIDSSEWRNAVTLHGDADASSADARTRLDGTDYMLTALPGRYLWLRVSMTGNGLDSPRLARVALDFPRISWRRYLPAIFGAEPASAEFTDRWLSLFDRSFRDLETTIDQQAALFDPLSAPAGGKHDFLGFLASWVGLTALSGLPLARRRAFLKHAPGGNGWRGTVRGLTQTLYLFFGLEHWCAYQAEPACCVPCPVTLPERFRWRPPRLLLEHFVLRRWLWLGAGRLSDNARLWGNRIVNRSQLGAPAPALPSAGCPLPGRAATGSEEACIGPVQAGPHGLQADDETARLGISQLKSSQDPLRDPFHVYAHKLSVFVPAACLRDPQIARTLAQLLKADMPAHVQHQLVPVEPRFRVGVQAMLGLDAVIGYRAVCPRLDEMKLGKATVLGGTNPDGGERSLRIGTRHIGMNTRLQ